MNPWNVIPLKEFPNLYVVREMDGNIVATVQKRFAETFGALPDLIKATQDIFEELRAQNPVRSKDSSLGRLENVISKIQKIGAQAT